MLIGWAAVAKQPQRRRKQQQLQRQQQQLQQHQQLPQRVRQLRSNMKQLLLAALLLCGCARQQPVSVTPRLQENWYLDEVLAYLRAEGVAIQDEMVIGGLEEGIWEGRRFIAEDAVYELYRYDTTDEAFFQKLRYAKRSSKYEVAAFGDTKEVSISFYGSYFLLHEGKLLPQFMAYFK